MALPINIEDLLNKRKVESYRIEFKKGWNPTEIYHCICAFANDFDNLGSGYILVGIEEENGIAKRPVTGINIEALDRIQKEMVGFDNLFEPYYLPRTTVKEIDGKPVYFIWAPSGVNRPYAIPSDVLSKVKQPKYYVRSGTSSIVAKGEVLDELYDMANRVPFDERPNPNISLSDMSMVLLRGYLATIGRMSEALLFTQPLVDTLEQMDLMDSRMIKNDAAMMFCEHSEGCGDSVVLNDTIIDAANDIVNLNDVQKQIKEAISNNVHITYDEIASVVHVSRKTVARHIAALKEKGVLVRIGEDKNGYWQIKP